MLIYLFIISIVNIDNLNMNNFNASILVLFDNINEKTREIDPTKKILNNTVTEKQYLAYYLYRIWIKYKKLVISINGDTVFNDVLNDLEIPVKYFNLDITFPMANKMTNNESKLDKVILKILKQFNAVSAVYDKSGTMTTDKSYESLLEYVEYKTIENIIQDILQIKILLPNLSRPASRYDVWGIVNKLLDTNSNI
jgi:hypothetical protein